ncbi:hypothetical protein G7D50_003375 [Salmonella enterica]|nr:hypothetical protein [Salmonella enterica]EJY5725054.1 hypothetical protein [Salmonella enterica]EKH2493405.1 hypothetical protein [Salmonella enterica]
MSDFIKYLFIFPCLWCANSFAITQTQWDGNFRIEELGEQLNDGSQVFLQYNLKIDSKNNRASLSMTTWHAGITCTGDYSLKINSGVLALYYNGDEENVCPYPSPQFEISNKGKTYYIKGKMFSYSQPGEWLPLKRITLK